MVDSRRHRRRFKWSADWLLILLLTAGAALLGAFNGLGRFDQVLYDKSMAASSRPASSNILLVTADDATLAKLGPWPWPRSLAVQLLGRLRETRAVGLAMFYGGPDTPDSQDTIQLADAIRRHGHVVLPTVLNNLSAPTRYDTADSRLTEAAAGVGFVNILPDDDGIIRRVQWRAQFGARSCLHMVLALLTAGGEQDKVDAILKQADRHGRSGIAYAGPSGHLRTVSYLQVLNGQVPRDWIDGKYVLIGSLPGALSHTLPTPVASMSSIELLGELLQAAQEETTVSTAPAWFTASGTALAILLLCLALRRSTPRRALLLSLGAAVLILAASYLILHFANCWIAPSAALLMLVLCYPMWCWRQQEAVLHHMDDELQRLREEYPPILSEAQMPSRLGKGPMESRMRELHQALTRVRNLRRFLTDGFDGIADPTFVSDRDGHLRLRNRAALAYFRDLSLRAPRLGQSTAWLLEQLVPDATTLMSKVGPALTGQQPDASPWRLDMEIQDRQGRSIILKCAPIHTNSGEFAGTVVTFNDISAIRQAERKREETLRFVSHDMRAPQNSILALVYLNTDETDLQKQRDAWSRIGQLARRTLRLVDDFVHLTRAESVRITPTVIDLSMLLHEALDDFWALAQTRSIDLSIDDKVPEALVCGDTALLLRAICNLLDNALKYTPSGGRVHVALQRDARNWLIRIIDSGTGIADEDIAQIFQPFSRVGPTARNDNNGAGLGLAFVHTVAWRHGGSVSVDSKPGAGSTFTLHLPVHTEEETLLTTEHAA